MTDKSIFRTDPEIMQHLGKRLRALRKARRLTQQEAVDAAGLSRSSIIRAEAGDNPTLLTLVRLLRVYGSLSEFDRFLEVPEVSPLEVAARARKDSGG